MPAFQRSGSTGKKPKSPSNCTTGRSLGDIINSSTFDIVSRNKVIDVVQEIFTPFRPEEGIIAQIRPGGTPFPVQIMLNPHWNTNHKHFYNIVLEFAYQNFHSMDDYSNPDKVSKFLHDLMSKKQITHIAAYPTKLRQTILLLGRFCCPNDDVINAYYAHEAAKSQEII